MLTKNKPLGVLKISAGAIWFSLLTSAIIFFMLNDMLPQKKQLEIDEYQVSSLLMQIENSNTLMKNNINNLTVSGNKNIIKLQKDFLLNSEYCLKVLNACDQWMPLSQNLISHISIVKKINSDKIQDVYYYYNTENINSANANNLDYSTKLLKKIAGDNPNRFENNMFKKIEDTKEIEYYFASIDNIKKTLSFDEYSALKDKGVAVIHYKNN